MRTLRDRVATTPLAVILGLAAVFASAAAPTSTFGAARRVFIGPDGQPLPFRDDEQVLDFLRHAAVLSSEPVRTGKSGAVRLLLDSQGIRARAVFRSIETRRTNLRMANGDAFATFYDSARFEVAAFELARLYGIDMIPPVVERRIDGRPGTVQLWIENSMTDGERAERRLRPPEAGRWRRQRLIMRAFDALVHNSDRNTGNSLIDADWNLWMIDHTRTFQRPRGGNDFGKIVQVPRAFWTALRTVSEGQIRDAVREILEPLQIASLLDRREALIEHLRQVIVERGEEAVVLS